MTGDDPSPNWRQLDYSAYDIKYEFLPTKRPPALSEDPFTPWSPSSVSLARSDKLTYLEHPMLGHLVEQDSLPGSDAVFGPSEKSITGDYEFNCEPWILRRSNSIETVQLSVLNNLSLDLTASVNVACAFDTCSNNAAAKLKDLPKAS